MIWQLQQFLDMLVPYRPDIHRPPPPEVTDLFIALLVTVMTHPDFNRICDIIRNISRLLISLRDSNIIQVSDHLCRCVFYSPTTQSLCHFRPGIVSI